MTEARSQSNGGQQKDDTLRVTSTSVHPVPNEAVMSIPVVFACLNRWRRFICAGSMVALLLATVVAFALKPTYTSTASFIPPGSSNPTSAAALMGQLSALGAGSLLGGKSQGDLYVGILKSHTIGAELVAKFNLIKIYKVKKESLAEKRLASKSLFEIGTKDPIVTISVTDESPVRARDLAKGYLDALQNTSGLLALSESSQRRLFYEQRLAKEKNDLANAEVAMKQAEETTGLIAPAGQTASNIQAMALVRAQITDRQTRVAALLHDETEQNPDILRLREEIGSLQTRAAAMEKGDSNNRSADLSSAKLPGLELEYIRRARDVKYHEALFEIIAKQYEAARLDEAKESPLQILDEPHVPDTKSGPSRALIMILGLLLGLLSTSAWTLFQTAKGKAPYPVALKR